MCVLVRVRVCVVCVFARVRVCAVCVCKSEGVRCVCICESEGVSESHAHIIHTHAHTQTDRNWKI